MLNLLFHTQMSLGLGQAAAVAVLAIIVAQFASRRGAKIGREIPLVLLRGIVQILLVGFLIVVLAARSLVDWNSRPDRHDLHRRHHRAPPRAGVARRLHALAALHGGRRRRSSHCHDAARHRRAQDHHPHPGGQHGHRAEHEHPVAVSESLSRRSSLPSRRNRICPGARRRRGTCRRTLPASLVSCQPDPRHRQSALARHRLDPRHDGRNGALRHLAHLRRALPVRHSQHDFYRRRRQLPHRHLSRSTTESSPRSSNYAA